MFRMSEHAWRPSLIKEVELYIRTVFWIMAHKRYHGRRLSFLVEFGLFSWATFFIIGYLSAFCAGWVPRQVGEIIVAIALLLGPLIGAIAYRRIRVESLKGSDALYRKRVEVEREFR
jgi:hypothetical protein